MKYFNIITTFFALFFLWYFCGFLSSFQVFAADFSIQTGYYVGDGASLSVTGLGFKPELVIIKPDTTAGAGAVFKTRVMPTTTVPYFIATADTTAGAIELDSDGFTVNSATTNSVNVGHTWIAFAGSDCSASGTFCVGSYIGNGTSPRAITTGFQPNLVWVKRSTAEGGNWRSSSMPDNYGQYFAATAQETTGALFTTLDATGFTVGATNNTSTGIYYYVAFKNVTGVMNVGSYTGNATDTRSITGVGFKPDFVFLKNADAGTPVSAVYSATESYGDNTCYFTDTANLVDSIQALETDGFQVGAHATSNGSGNTVYYAAFKGAATHSASGTFKMASGSYTGTGGYFDITNLDFSPDLVIIKGNVATAGVFRTSMMGGDSTAYLDSGTANLANAIISLNTNGFSVGTHASVNTSGTAYYWTAFGNAWKPQTHSGAADFFVGAYYGNGINDRNITRIPFQPDMVTVKRSGATGGTFRTSTLSGDLSSFFAATAETADNIQALNTDGFQIGTTANVNTAANVYWYFGFKTGSNFYVGGYTGNGVDNRDITDPNFQPNLVWVKRSTAVAAVARPSGLTGDNSTYFTNTVNATGRIKDLISTGFRLGTQTEVNTDTATYRYVAWRIPSGAVISISLSTDGTVSYGAVAAGASKSTLDLSDTQTIHNDGDVAVDCNIKTSAPAGWSLGSSASTDVFVHEFSTNGGSNWTKFDTVDTYQSLVTNLGVSSNQNFDLRFTVPNPSTSYTEKSVSITIQAVQH